MEDKEKTISGSEIKRLFRISDGRTIESYVKEGILIPTETGGAYQNTIFDRHHICKITGLKKIPDEPMMTSGEAMNMLGYPKEKKISFRGYCRRRKIPHYFFKANKGGRMYFLRSELEIVKDSEGVWDNEFADFVARNYMFREIIKYVFNSTMMDGISGTDKDVIDIILFRHKNLNTASIKLQTTPENTRRMFVVACKRLLFQLKLIDGQMKTSVELIKENAKLKSENKVLLDRLNEGRFIPETISEPDISVLARQINSMFPILGHNAMVRVKSFIKLLHAENLNDLTKYRRSDIEKYRGVGRKTVNALEILLINNGLKFKDEELLAGKDKRGRGRGANNTGESIMDTLMSLDRRLLNLERGRK